MRLSHFRLSSSVRSSMRKGHVALVAGLLCLPVACQDYLDVNTNPNAPQSVAPNLYLAPMLHWMATAPQYDGRFIGHFTQEWYSSSTSTSPAGTWGRWATTRRATTARSNGATCTGASARISST